MERVFSGSPRQHRWPCAQVGRRAGRRGGDRTGRRGRVSQPHGRGSRSVLGRGVARPPVSLRSQGASLLAAGPGRLHRDRRFAGAVRCGSHVHAEVRQGGDPARRQRYKPWWLPPESLPGLVRQVPELFRTPGRRCGCQLAKTPSNGSSSETTPTTTTAPVVTTPTAPPPQ